MSKQRTTTNNRFLSLHKLNNSLALSFSLALITIAVTFLCRLLLRHGRGLLGGCRGLGDGGSDVRRRPLALRVLDLHPETAQEMRE